MTKISIAVAVLSIAAAPTSSSAHVFRALSDDGDAASSLSIRQAADAADASSVSTTITVPEYTPDQCSTWLSGVLAADADDSGGLSADEFHDFLQSLDDPPYIADFFDKNAESYLALPWLFKVAYKSLACRCVSLGLGENCCAGQDAEIPFAGLRDDETERQSLTREQAAFAAEYRADMCNSVAAVFEEVIPPPAPSASPEEVTPATTDAPVVPVVPETTTASPVATTPDDPVVPAPATTTSAPVPATSAPTAAAIPVDSSSDDTTAPCGPGTEVSCLTVDVVGSVIDYSSFDYSEIFQRNRNRRLQIPEFYNAEEITTNEGDNDILGHAVKGFLSLSARMWAERMGRRNLLRGGEGGGGGRDLQDTVLLEPTQVTDIDCPADLVYAPKAAYCINFGFRFKAVDGNENEMADFMSAIETAANEGDLYDIIISEYPETLITGMGGPGKGINYLDPVVPSIVGSPADSVATMTEESTGLGAGLTILIIAAVVIIPMAFLALYSKHSKKKEEERMHLVAERNAKRDLESANRKEDAMPGVVEEDDRSASSSGSIVEMHNDDDDGPSKARSAAGSSLAAMGAAGAAATISKKDVEKGVETEVRSSIVKLVEELDAPKTAEELLASYAGREDELLGHLEKMKAKQSSNDEIRSLVKKTNAPKDADELLAAYAGRENELLGHLKKMEAKQDQKDEIARLVAATGANKSATELMAAYDGREDELIKNLRRMESNNSTRKSIVKLVEEIKPGKTADELLASYKGREDELLKNLTKLQSKRELKSSQTASIRGLVDETKPGKSAEELLATYDGREDELIKNLTKMKAKQEMKASNTASVRSLVGDIKPGKSAEELLAAYEGREDELIKNLEKMKAKKERNSLVAEKQQSVRLLVDETSPGKTAEELMAMYDGKEDELIKNLEKMKAKQEATKEAEQQEPVQEIKPDHEKSRKQESIRMLVEETGPGKTAEELLAAYDGKEDELIKNLEKMKAKQDQKREKQVNREMELKAEKQKSIRALVDETIPGKSAEELLEMYDGKEDKLIKNLEKMKSKQSIKALANKQQSVRELVDETNPGKSAEELLTMYDGKEDVLINNLEKMKTKQNKEASKVDSAKAETIASITALVEETNPGKSAEELLAAYDGKEDELLKNLSKMKSKKDINAKTEKQAEIKALVKSTNPGKSAEELIAAYDGKEDELIKNLTKMKSKQDMKASSSSDDKQKALVRTLVKETNPGKSADDLLKAYAGREDELVAHLSKLKKSTRNIA